MWYIKNGFYDKKVKGKKFLGLDLDRVIGDFLVKFGFATTEDCCVYTPVAVPARETLTQSEAYLATIEGTLIPRQSYLITGVDVPLYGGTDIILTAITTNQFSIDGHGIFFNPRYTPNNDFIHDGYGVWHSGLTPAIGSTIIWGGKHWVNTSGAVGTSTDQFTLAAAHWTVIPFNSTDYKQVVDSIRYDFVHDRIIHREDYAGNKVSYEDAFITWYLDYYGFEPTDFRSPINAFQWGNNVENLNFNTEVQSGTNNNVVDNSYYENINFRGLYCHGNYITGYSIITTSFLNGYFYGNFIERSNMSGNTGEYNFRVNYCKNATITNNISSLYNIYIQNNTILHSRITSNNACSINNNTLTSDSRIHSNTGNGVGSINDNTLNGKSLIQTNIFSLGSSSSINGNTLSGAAYIQANTLGGGALESFITGNFLTLGGNIRSNNLSGADVGSKRMTGNYLPAGTIRNNTFGVGTSDISYNVLKSYNSEIHTNTMANNNSITFNELIGQSSITAINGCSVGVNTLNNSTITSFTGTNSFVWISRNNLTASTFNGTNSGSMSSKFFQYLEFKQVSVTENVSAATIIQGTQTYPRTVYTRPDGTKRVSYLNNSDAVVITAITT